jgi:WD40 repeat protein
MQTIRIALIVSSFIMIGSLGGCGNQESSSSTATQAPAPKVAIDQSDITLPEYYGLYAIDDGKTIEIKEGGQPAAFTPAVEFLLFHKMAAMASGNAKLYRLNLQPPPPKPADDGSFKGWDDWFQKSQVDFPNQMQAAMSGIPAGSTQVELREKPVTNQQEMLRLVPAAALEPGLYQMDRSVRFWVERDKFRAQSVDKAQNAMSEGRYAEAREAASLAVVVHDDDVEMQSTMRSLQLEASIKLAQSAMDSSQWKSAEQELKLAELFATTNEAKANVANLQRVELGYRRSIADAITAVHDERWVDALEAIERAWGIRPDSKEARGLYASVPRIPLFGHAEKQRVWFVRFLNDGSLFSACNDGTIFVWDCERRAPKATFENKTKKRWFIAPHPSLEWIAIAGNDDALKGFIDLVHTSNGSRDRFLAIGATQDFTSVTSSPDGKYLVVATNEWLVGFNNKLMTKQRAAMYEQAIAKQANPTEAATRLKRGHDLPGVEVWDMQAKSLWRVLPRTENLKSLGVDWAEIAPDAKTLVAVSKPKGDNKVVTTCEITIWDVDDGRPTHTFNVSDCAFYAIAIDPSSKRLVGNEKGDAVVWDLASGKQVNRLPTDLSQVYTIDIADTGQVLALGGVGGVRLVDMETGSMLARFQEQGDVTTVAISPDGKWVATGSNNDRSALALWRIPDAVVARCTTGKHVMRVSSPGDTHSTPGAASRPATTVPGTQPATRAAVSEPAERDPSKATLALLKQISIACATHGAEWSDKMPPDERQFWTYMNGRPEASPFGPVSDGGGDYWIALAGQFTTAKGKPMEMYNQSRFPDKQIMAYDRASYEKSDRVGVLFFDGHIDSISKPELSRLLADPANKGADFRLPGSAPAEKNQPLPLNDLQENVFSGKWKGGDGHVFSFELRLSTKGAKVEGEILWTLTAAPRGSAVASKIGSTGTEFVTGTYSESSRQFDLKGVRVSDSTFLGMDQYKLTVSADGESINGKSRGNGDWSNTLEGSRKTAP